VVALESNDTSQRGKFRPQRDRLKHIKEIRLAIEPSRKVGLRKGKLKKAKANTRPKSILKRAKCKERDLNELQEDGARATRLRSKEGTNLRTISMVHTMIRSITSNTMVKKLHIFLSSNHIKKAANTKPLVDSSNNMTNTTTRSIIRKLHRPTRRKVKGSTESVRQREVHSMRQRQLRVKMSLIEPREPVRIMVSPCPIKVSSNMKGELPISREEAASMLNLHSIKRLILKIKKAIEEVRGTEKTSPRDIRQEDLNIRKEPKLKKGDQDKSSSRGKKETISTKKVQDMLKKVPIIKMSRKCKNKLKLKSRFALRSLITSVEVAAVVMVEAPSTLMIRRGLINPGKIEGTHLDKGPSKMSKTKKSNRIKRKASRRSRRTITDLEEKAEAGDMWKEIESNIITIARSVEEAEASEMRIDRSGAKTRSLIVLITIVKTATKRMPIRLSQGLISKPSQSKEYKRRKTLSRIGETMTVREEMIIVKTANSKIASHSATRNPTGGMTTTVEKLSKSKRMLPA